MADWTEEEKRKIWDKGEIVLGYDKNAWRKDQCGAFIKWDKYGGDRSDKFNNGWLHKDRVLLVTADHVCHPFDHEQGRTQRVFEDRVLFTILNMLFVWE